MYRAVSVTRNPTMKLFADLFAQGGLQIIRAFFPLPGEALFLFEGGWEEAFRARKLLNQCALFELAIGVERRLDPSAPVWFPPDTPSGRTEWARVSVRDLKLIPRRGTCWGKSMRAIASEGFADVAPGLRDAARALYELRLPRLQVFNGDWRPPWVSFQGGAVDAETTLSLLRQLDYAPASISMTNKYCASPPPKVRRSVTIELMPETALAKVRPGNTAAAA